MLYAILCYDAEDVVWSWSEEQNAAVMARLGVVQEKLARQQRLGPVARLLPTTAATTVRKGAEALVILSNVPGLLRDPGDPATLVPRLAAAQLGSDAYAQGRMKKKLLGAGEAIAGGVARVVLAGAGGKSPVRDALAGMGTVIA